MMAGVEHVDHRRRQFQLPLDRLVGIGVGPQRDRRDPVVRLAQGIFEQPRNVVLGKQPGFEIQPRRQPHEGVAWPRVAIGTAVLAAPVGIDRTVKAQIGGLVEGQD